MEATATRQTDSFCQFQQFPFEIRDRIWFFCIDTHRSISVQQTNDGRLAFRKDDVPAVLEVCEHSRRVAREVYEPLLKPNSSGLQFYAHIASDCLYIQTGRQTPAIERTLFNFAGCLEAVISPSRTLAMPLHSVLPHKENCYWCLRGFMNDEKTFYMGTLSSLSRYSAIPRRGLDEYKIGKATEFMDSDDDDMPELEGENANESEGEGPGRFDAVRVHPTSCILGVAEWGRRAVLGTGEATINGTGSSHPFPSMP